MVGNAPFQFVPIVLVCAESQRLRLGSWSERSSMHPSMRSTAWWRDASEAATLCAAKNSFTPSRASAEQNEPVELTSLPPVSMVNWACTLSQLAWMYFHV